MTLLAPNLWAWRVEWGGHVHLSSGVDMRRDDVRATLYCGEVGVPVPGTLTAYKSMSGNPADYRPVDCPPCRHAAMGAAKNLMLMIAGEEELWRRKLGYRLEETP